MQKSSDSSVLPTSQHDSDKKTQLDTTRRCLITAACATGSVAGLATIGMFAATLQPSERAKVAGAPVEVDLSGMAAGDMRTVKWRGKPVWIVKRSKEMIATLDKTEALVADPHSKRHPDILTPPYARNPYRSILPDFFVAMGICSHLGCSPVARFVAGSQPFLPDDWQGGFLCPCHGSTFDFAGRVYKNKPAPDNLTVPRHMFTSDTTLIIGRDEKGEA